MNDKKQLAAMGEHLADQQPMCMAKRVEELEAQVEKLTNRMAWRNTGSPNGLRRFMTQKQYDAQTPGVQKWYEPIRYEVPEGWQLEDLDNDCIVVRKDGVGFYVASFNAENIASTILHALASDMLAAAPKLEAK